MTQTQIHRKADPLNQPYPRNGNFGTQKPTYQWLLYVNGRNMGVFYRLRDAKEAASDYTKSKPEIVR